MACINPFFPGSLSHTSLSLESLGREGGGERNKEVHWTSKDPTGSHLVGPLVANYFCPYSLNDVCSLGLKKKNQW